MGSLLTKSKGEAVTLSEPMAISDKISRGSATLSEPSTTLLPLLKTNTKKPGPSSAPGLKLTQFLIFY